MSYYKVIHYLLASTSALGQRGHQILARVYPCSQHFLEDIEIPFIKHRFLQNPLYCSERKQIDYPIATN